MQIAILGPLEVRGADGAPREVAGARLRTLLTRLALDVARPVAAGSLADAVWGEALPAETANALQTLVSRLRRALGDPAVVAQGPGGYRLELPADAIDAERFVVLADEGAAALRRGEPTAAAALLDDALALWRGDPLEGTGLDAAARRLTERRITAEIDRGEAALATADAGRLLTIERLVAEHPLDERLAGLHIRTLAAAGRQADALLAYEALRGRLAEELGSDPSAELKELHLSLLREPAAPPPRRSNLKAPLTSFVGRDEEVTRIGKTLEQHRLVTLVGPGGAGKTRLANEAAARVADRAPDGVWLVELAAVTAPGDVPHAVLGAVGGRELHLLDRPAQSAPRDALTRLQEALADARAVVVLDNCEHLVEASAQLAGVLLGACPQLRVLATSREPLGIVGEALLAVPPLAQPAPDATAADALEFPAVRLFADRAAAASPGFEVTSATVRAVVEIVRRLDGLPLAIELAAARLRALPLDDVAARLSDRFRLLTGGSRTALPRHRTLRAVVEWSWELLTDAERAMVERLCVFPAGITAQSAAAVRPDGVDEVEVGDLLAALVDRSLLQRTGDQHRVRMLETIREYGAERLGERGELAAARRRHADHFAALVGEAEPQLITAGQLPWFAWLVAERENILAALRFRCDDGDADGALRIAVTLGTFSMMLGDHSDVAEWLADALAVPGGTDAQLRTVARGMHALNRTALGPRADGPADEELAGLAAELDDIDPAGSPVLVAVLRPALAFFGRDEARARRYLEEALGHPDDWTRAAALMLRANFAENSGDIASMRADVEAALDGFRRIGERWGWASTLRTMASLRTLEGDLDGAAAAYAEALELTREFDSRDDEAFVYGGLAEIALRRGDTDEARRYIDLARDSAEITGGGMEAIFSLSILGDLEYRTGLHAEGRAHVLAALAQLADTSPSHPARNHIRAMVTASAARIRLADGDVAGAHRLAGEAYEAAVTTADLPIIASAGMVGVALAAAAGRPEVAACRLGATARLRGAEDATSLDVQELTTRLRSVLGDAAFERAYREGRDLAVDEATARLDPADLAT